MRETIEREHRTQRAEKPAVGIDAVGTCTTTAAGRILRARHRDYDVFVRCEPDSELDELADEIGFTVVDVTSDEDAKSSLISAARQAGFPGLIFIDNDESRRDLVRSEESLVDSSLFVVDAAVASAVGTNLDSLIAIPAYEEAQTIGTVVEEARVYVDEVLVIDDGSTDETRAAASEAGATVVSHQTNKGYGGALKTAFQEADRCGADRLVVLDGDGQHDAADVPALLGALDDDNAQIAIGSRFVGEDKHTPLYRRFGLAVINLLTNATMGPTHWRDGIRDTQSGFRAYDRTTIESLAEDTSIGESMDASLDILYHAHDRGYDITEVETTIRYDREGANSMNPISHGLKLVNSILTTVERDHPILILGVPGVISTLLGMGFGYWTVVNFITTQTFPIGLAVASVFFVLTGILSSFTVINLHAVNQLYERHTSTAGGQ